jgi:protein-disulfide isomerase
MAADGMKRFYLLLALVAVAGLGVIGFQAFGKARISIPANVQVLPADTAGFRGYVLGSDSAPVEITEYADYQCPACQDFEVVQMPTIFERLIQTGRLRWRYRDFPLDQIHRHTRVAAHSAACADEQGKYWDQHHRIYSWTPDWTVKRDAAGVFRDYAKLDGLDLGKYDACMQTGKYAGRIEASSREGVALGVHSTPTFLIAGRLYPGSMAYDEVKKLVDSLSPPAKPAQ